jgi:CMP-N-acetylneuraminic acid synthetase
MASHKYLAVIPARAGSKGLPGKNLHPFLGKPLICRTIEAAIASRLCDVCVTTDSTEILDLIESKNYHILTVTRPPELATDTIPLSPSIIHAYEAIKGYYGAIITLQPTSPLLYSDDIINAVDIYEKKKPDTVISVTEEYHSIWLRDRGGYFFAVKQNTMNRQQTTPAYVVNGAIFITNTNTLLEKKDRVGDKVELYVMPQERSIDIHTKEDIELGEFIYTQSVEAKL